MSQALMHNLDAVVAPDYLGAASGQVLNQVNHCRDRTT